PRRGGTWTRERRFVTEAARAIDRAEQDLQKMQRTAGVKSVGMRRDAAHGMHRNRPAHHGFVAAARPVGPRLRVFDRALERRVGELARDAPDLLRRYSTAR